MTYPIEFERYYELMAAFYANPYEENPRWIIEAHAHAKPAKIKDHAERVAACKAARYQEWIYKNYP